MSDKLVSYIRIEITDINLNDYYFNFHYVINVNSKTQEGIYSSDHSRKNDLAKFKEELQNWWAMELALDQLDSTKLH